MFDQRLHFGCVTSTSDLPQSTDIARPIRLVWFVPNADQEMQLRLTPFGDLVDTTPPYVSGSVAKNVM
jgi:hypothetical protein